MADLATVAERKQALDEARPLPPGVAEAVSIWFEVELILAEAGLEGLPVDREEVARVVSGETGDLLTPAAVELANLRTALGWLGGRVDGWEGAVDDETVRTLHRLLRRGLAEDAGRYRTKALRQSPATEPGEEVPALILPRPAVVPMLMGRIGTWLRTVEPGPEAAAEAHYRLLRIQPFGDRNQTVARFLMNLILGLGGYPPVVIPEEAQTIYRQAVEVSLGRQDKRPWQSFFLERLEVSLDLCLLAAADPAGRDPAPPR